MSDMHESEKQKAIPNRQCPVSEPCHRMCACREQGSAEARRAELEAALRDMVENIGMYLAMYGAGPEPESTQDPRTDLYPVWKLHVHDHQIAVDCLNEARATLRTEDSHDNR